ncbi:DUF192 domain-containing protein [Candidatus Wolfebacteria bacterium]|nr:DUF192 domain-containing protein [Candidatus Wolfebacteria bacterium]
MNTKIQNYKNIFKKILLVVLGIFAGIVFLLIGKTQITDHSEKIILNIDGRDYTLLTARTILERTRGLSGIKELKGADGMIFYFDWPKKISFWNKNTHLDLELVWMRDGKIIGRNFLPSEDKAGLFVKNSPQEVDWVVEIVK